MTECPECPKCGSRTFGISAHLSTTAIVEFEDDHHNVLDEIQGDLEWDDDDTAVCRGCGHEAPLGQMVVP